MTEKIDLSFRQHATRHQSIPNFSNRTYITGQSSSSAVPIFRPNAAVTVQWIYAQVSAACTIQLLFNGQPISAPYNVPANTLIRFPGLLVPNNTALALAVSAGDAQFEVAYVKDFKPELIVQEPAVYIPQPSISSMAITSPLDSAGSVYVDDEGRKVSYRAGQSYASLPAGFIFGMSGSASKLVKVKYIRFAATQTTAGVNLLYIIKDSTFLVGGTVGAAMSVGPLDSADPVFTVAHGPQVYSAAASEGTRILVCDMYSGLIPSPTVGSAFVADFRFTESGAKPLTLRGANECVTMFLNTAIPAGANTAADIVIEWTEE